MQNYNLNEVASQVRRDVVRMVTNATSGHPGGALSSADIVTALYFKVMNIDPATWTRDAKNSDVFHLSAGHLSALLYSVLARRGFFPVEELNTFRQFGSRLQGHPSIERGLPGVHQASGSLGQGLSVACGIALNKKLDNESNYVYALMGDGECEEGQIWEAAMFAAQHKLNNVIGITDWNGQQIDGSVDSVMSLGDLEGKWKSFGWNCIVADGHNMEEVVSSFENAKEEQEKPTMILFKTDMGHGVDFMAGTHKWHGQAPTKEQCEDALSQIEKTINDF